MAPSAYSSNPTFGISLGHFNVIQESLIIETKKDIVKVVDFLVNLLQEEILPLFDRLSTLKSVDLEFNRENRPLNLFPHDAFDRPLIGSTVAALTNNPRFEYWENYYRDKIKRTTVQRQEKYESLILYLKEEILTD